MATSPSLSKEPPKTCFSCIHFHGEVASRSAIICHRPGCSNVQASPDTGCSGWADNPAKDPDVLWLVEFVAKHQTAFSPRVPAVQFKKAISGEVIRALFDLSPTPSAKALAWELARALAVIGRIEAVAVIAVDDHSAAAVEKCRRAFIVIKKLLADEPCVKERNAKIMAACSAAIKNAPPNKR